MCLAKLSLVKTLSFFKSPSCTACHSHKKRTSTCRVFPHPGRADVPLAALLSQSIPSACAEDLSNAWYSDSLLLDAMVLCTALPCLIKSDLHTTAIPERDLRVPKSAAWSAAQNTSKTLGNVCGSKHDRSKAPNAFEILEVFHRGTLHPSCQRACSE